MTIKSISDVEPKTHKLRTLKEAYLLGYNIPETYSVSPPIQGDLDFINSLEDCNWLIRPSLKESKAGLEGVTCTRGGIRNGITDVLSRYGGDVELILQKYVQSDRAGIMLSSDGVYIESVCGSGFGLTRGGTLPSSYRIQKGDISAHIVRQEKKHQMLDGKIIEEKCGEYSSIPRKLLDELYKMSSDFREKLVDWCSEDEKLYFLEYWHIPEVLNKKVQGRITHLGSERYDILVLPDARIGFFLDAMKSKAVIVKAGGYLSHLAKNCCEQKIPFIISEEEYVDGELVFIDEKERRIVRLNGLEQ